MNKQKCILVFSVILVIVISSVKCLGAIQNHESLPYKIVLINKSNSNPLLLTARADIIKGFINIEYRPCSGEKESFRVNVAEIQKDYSNIKLLGSSMFEFNPIGVRESSKTINYLNLKLKKNTILVIWTSKSNDNLTIQKKNEIIDNTKVILGEQGRLTEVQTYKGNDELTNEVTRNYEE